MDAITFVIVSLAARRLCASEDLEADSTRQSSVVQYPRNDCQLAYLSDLQLWKRKAPVGK